MLPKVPGGTMAMADLPGQDSARAGQLLATMDRMLQLMERFLERAQAPRDAR